MALGIALESARLGGRDPYELTAPPMPGPSMDDFDFHLSTRSGLEYLDLKEFKPYQGPHDSAPGAYLVSVMADAMWRLIARMSRHYESRDGTPIHLLIFTTDWRFQLSEGVLALVRHRAATCAHRFKSIAYLLPDDAKAGNLSMVFPAPEPQLDSPSLLAIGSKVVMIADPNTFRIDPDGRFSVKFAAPGQPTAPRTPTGTMIDAPAGSVVASTTTFEVPLRNLPEAMQRAAIDPPLLDRSD